MLRCALIALCGIPLSSYANLFVGNTDTGAIEEYTNSGIAINLSLITGLELPRDIAISGDKLFILTTDGKVGVYTTSGQTLNASLITGVGHAVAIGVFDDSIFIGTNVNHGTVAEYTTSGALVNGSLITGLQSAFDFGFFGDLALSGNNLFIASWGTNNGLSYQSTLGKYTLSGIPVNPAVITTDGIATALAVSGFHLFMRSSPDNQETRGIDTIGKYTTSGITLDASLISGLTDPAAIAISGDDLFVAEADKVGKYTIAGEPVDPSLITGTGFGAGQSIAVSGPASVPEPHVTVWLALTLAGLLVKRGRQRRSSLSVIGPKAINDLRREAKGDAALN
jgi:hypothetical protein